MKNILLILLLTVAGLPAIHAQDVITLKNGNEIKVKVLEVGTTEVKYKKYGSESGPTYTEAKSAIFMIRYEDGTKDVFGSAQESTTTSRPQQQQQQASRPAAQQTARSQNQAVRTTAARATAAAPPQEEYVAEPPHRKAYMGIGVGAAIPSESRVFNTGVQVTVNFGYLFTEHVGIAATGFLTSFPVEIYRDATMGLNGVLVGPLFSMPANATRSIELDLRPMIGAARGHAVVGGESGSDDKFIFSFGVGGSARFNLSDNFSLSGNLDYINGEMKDYGFSLSSVGISVGANYRF